MWVGGVDLDPGPVGTLPHLKHGQTLGLNILQSQVGRGGIYISQKQEKSGEEKIKALSNNKYTTTNKTACTGEPVPRGELQQPGSKSPARLAPEQQAAASQSSARCLDPPPPTAPSPLLLYRSTPNVHAAGKQKKKNRKTTFGLTVKEQ